MLLAALCACAGPGASVRDAGEPVPGLTIAAEVDPVAGVLRLDYTFVADRVPLPPRLRVALPHEWAGWSDLGDDIHDVTVTDAAGRPLPVAIGADGVAAVSVADTDTVVLRYVVRPSRRILTHATRFRALQSADRFFAPGLAVLAVPLDLGEGFEEAVRFEARCQDPAWCVRATVPLDAPLPLRHLTDAALFAGRFDRADRSRDGRSVTVWVEAGVRPRAHALADLALSVVEAQADLLGADVSARTTVVALLREDDARALNGAGRAGGFVLELGADVDLGAPEVAELVAHENFHRLNGHTLRYAAVDEFATMWFREGVTDYVAMRNAAERGLVASTRFFAFLGRALANYHGSPVRDAIAGEIGVRFWMDRDLRRLPYDKGALLGLLLDLELRASGDGGLDAFLAHLRDTAAAGGMLVTNSSLREALEAWTGQEWEAFWSSYVLGGDVLPVFERLNEIGLRVVERVEPAPYFGFRSSVTVAGGWYVSAVDPGSPAESVGLRSGMDLSGEPYVPDGALGGDAILEIRTDRGTRRLSITAGRGQRRTFALIAEDDVYRNAFGLGAR